MIRHFADGGSVPARVSNGEYRMNKSAVSKYGVKFMDAINSGKSFSIGGLVGKALADAADNPGHSDSWGHGLSSMLSAKIPSNIKGPEASNSGEPMMTVDLRVSDNHVVRRDFKKRP